MDLTVEFVSQNIVIQENFVEFQDIKNFTFFEAKGVGHAKGICQAICQKACKGNYM